MYVKKPITRIDTLRMAVTLGHPPVCDFCGGMFPVFMYASKRTSTGLDIQAWRWAACFPCTVAIEKKDKQKLLQRLVRRLAVLTTVADEDIVRAAAEQSLSEFYDYVVEETPQGKPFIMQSKPPATVRSYQVNVYVDKEWVSNGLRFATETEAERYAADLSARWIKVESYDLQPSPDEPNAQMLRYGRYEKASDNP
jgi:hypothetical protein